MVKLDEQIISRGIVEAYMRELMDSLSTDVAVVGGGPSGIIAAYYLARRGVKTAVFERKLSIGGGMWGGGMMFNKIVIQETARGILDELGVRYTAYEPGYYLADAVEAVAVLVAKAAQAGAKFFNLMSAEDVMIENERVTGLVINWTPVELNKLHVDPLAIRAKYVVDATGHPAEVVQTLVRKTGVQLNTPSGKIEGEKPMWADKGELSVVDFTREAYPGLYVSGMAAIAVYGGYRMGPIFGGMLLSGQKLAGLLGEQLGK